MNHIKRLTTEESLSRSLDSADPLASFRNGFHLLPGAIYMLGNSLGLMPKKAEEAVRQALADWRDLGIGGWLDGTPPWFYMAERNGEAAAGLVGASPDEVICTGTTTYNVHSLISTFYRPQPGRSKIICCPLDFPTDIYALKSQIQLHGLDWREHLVPIAGDDEGIVDEDDIIAAMTEEVALVQLPSVLYRSGQLLDIQRLTAAAGERGVVIGFDCSHSVGVVPHHFNEWQLDYAMWCGYKYLCGGPGTPGFIYLNKKHFAREPGLAGWFGYVKNRQFELNADFEHQHSAGGWQVSAPSIFGAAAMAGALEVVNEAGIERIREKSLRMVEYLMYLADEILSGSPYGFSILTPRDSARHGGHVALTREEGALAIKETLASRGVIADFRPPNVIRLAPSPLYNTYHDIWNVVIRIRDVIDAGEIEESSPSHKPIT